MAVNHLRESGGGQPQREGGVPCAVPCSTRTTRRSGRPSAPSSRPRSSPSTTSGSRPARRRATSTTSSASWASSASSVPEEYGGAGDGLVQVRGRACTRRPPARASASAAPACTSLLVPAVPQDARHRRAEEALPARSSSPARRCGRIAMTEPGTGSDLAGMKTTAKLSEDGTHYVLNGAKTFITGGVHADRVIVCARTAAAHARTTAATASPCSWWTPSPRATPSAASSTSSA